MIPRIAITPGEPAGIGPDMCIQLAQLPQAAELVCIADPVLLQHRATQLGLPLKIDEFDAAREPSIVPVGTLRVLPIACPQPDCCGSPDPINARYVLATLDRAVQLCQQQICQALVTGPVHKAIINDAGIPFTGHTEYLAEKTATPLPVMMLATGTLRVALATTHLPIASVAQAITREGLEQVLRILHHDLQTRFAIPDPRILVCGLNPHAGENGHLGREEIDIIIPLLDALRAEGMSLTGPLPADSLFTTEILARGDAVLAMYHDQGLPVLKFAGFGEAVNITLGLPIVRTSVDHGTALELAGTGRARISSLQAAIAAALDIVQCQQRSGA